MFTRGVIPVMGLLLTLSGTVGAQVRGPSVSLEESSQLTEYRPPAVDEVRVDQKLGASVPMDLMLTDERGEAVRLGDLFVAGKPVILNLGYYECPMLCGLVLDGVLDAVKAMETRSGWLPGDQYTIVTVSIDPREGYQLAAGKKATYLSELGRSSAGGTGGAGAGWHFLVGEQAQLEQLADAVGWRYAWSDPQQQYAHPAALVLLTPQGQVSRYLFGTAFESQTLRLSLVEASEGGVGSMVDAFLLTCLRFDPTVGKYNAAAMALMRIGGATTVIVLTGLIGMALWMEHRRKHRDTTPPSLSPQAS